jgi:aspartate carbamoyltransferase catalytic subunit
MSLKGKSLVSINDYSKSEWLNILKIAERFEKKQPKNLLAGKVIASLFFEPSTRTRLSFESAVAKLGGNYISFSDSKNTSTKKGETLKDTVRVVSKYADLLVMRHPVEGSARLASEYASVPVVNGGDGANQHPTQTLLDMYAILKTQGKLDGLKIGFAGDLKYSRTIHSLIHAMAEFNTTFVLASPPQLSSPDSILHELDNRKCKYTETHNLIDAVGDTDILYINRVQQERFADPLEYEMVKNVFVLKHEHLKKTKKNFKILNPLPRINEISEEVDEDPRAYYFEQVEGGVYVRQALIASILGSIK